VVAEITRNLTTVGVKPTNIVIHERGGGQILAAEVPEFVPAGSAWSPANTWLGYDPDVYVEVNFFGEEDTRSYLIPDGLEQFTKIINVPNMKDHGASGVTGCLKNIAYGEFNNVARSHYQAQTETLTFIGTLATSSRCVRARCSTSWTACAACGTPARSRGTGSTASIPSS
jgi:hypothetical protein